ncbi:MAG: helix-turn-helix transcriptional regulator [Armatimonadetes bacterium]|nr:helix-turn-helix transcriptional regulator [Armatimonadota bacterium]
MVDISGLPVRATPLRPLREAANMSLGKLALLSGVNKSTISRWEGGKTAPRRTELRAVCDALGIPLVRREALMQSLGVLPEPLVSANAVPMPVSGDLLRALRYRRGLTQSQAARRAGITSSVLSKWESGDDWPADDRMHALCFVLGATGRELVLLSRGRFLPVANEEGDTPEGLANRADTILESLRRTMWFGSDEVYLPALVIEAKMFGLLSRCPKAVQVFADARTLRLLITDRQAVPALTIRKEAEQTEAVTSRLGNYLLPHQRIAASIIKLQTLRTALLVQNRRSGFAHLARQVLRLLPFAQNSPEHRHWILMEAANMFAYESGHATEAARLAEASMQIPTLQQNRRRGNIVFALTEALILARIGAKKEPEAVLSAALPPGSVLSVRQKIVHLELLRSTDNEVAQRNIVNDIRADLQRYSLPKSASLLVDRRFAEMGIGEE